MNNKSTYFIVTLHLSLFKGSKMRFGFHISIAGGFSRVVERARVRGCETIQFGHRMGSTVDQAMEAVSQGIDQAFQKVKNNVILLLENTAGQGSEIGYTFEQIKKIIEEVEENDRMGVCLDTAPSFEARYDLSNKDGIEKTLQSFDQTIGLTQLHLLP